MKSISKEREKYLEKNMNKIFNVKDRQEAFDFILSIAQGCDKIIALVQVGSGAVGFKDDRSDLDFVVAIDSASSMLEVMDYMHKAISEKYNLVYFTQAESRHLQCYVIDNLLEIDIGYGSYEHAAALKPDFKVLYDNTGTVEEKMKQSREWMDKHIYGDKKKKDIELARNSVWVRLMHAAVAINRGNFFRATGELEYVRKLYIDLLGDKYCLESTMNKEIDRLPDVEKNTIKSTFSNMESPASLWSSLENLTNLIYKELEGESIPVSKEMLFEYYKDIR